MAIHVTTHDTVNQAAAAMNPNARYFGGGTLIMRDVNYANHSYDSLVVSTDPVLQQIETRQDTVHIGAGVTMSMILQHPQLDFLAEAARSVGGPAVRNMATVGGNLFAPRPYGDMTTALLALDAIVYWASGQQQSLEQLLEQTRNLDDSSGPTDIVTAVSVKRPASGEFRYLKVSRVKPKGVSLLTVAISLNRSNGRIADARVVFGGMAPRPRRARAAEQALEGASLDEAGIQSCLAVANDGMEPVDDALASAWYRQQVAPVYLKRALLQRSEY